MYPKAKQPTIGNGFYLWTYIDAILPAVRKPGKDLSSEAPRNLNAVTTVVWNRLATEVLTLLFVWNFESKYQNFFLRLPCKNFESCDNLNIQTLKHSYWFYSPRKTLPQNSAGTSTAKNTGSKHVQWRSVYVISSWTNDITPYKLNIPRDHVQANEIVQHSKRTMGLPFLFRTSNNYLVKFSH